VPASQGRKRERECTQKAANEREWAAVNASQDQAGLIEKWRLRHAYPDALGMWAASTAPQAYAFAFNAIAQDPRVLYRAHRLQAVKLACQAEEFALSLAQSGTPMSETWLAAALYVQQAIDAWRRSLRAYERRVEIVSVGIGQGTTHAHLLGPWEIAQRNFPHVDDETGRLAIRILHEFGDAVLKCAQKPWDHVIALAVLRYASRRLRGELLDPASYTKEAAIADILCVQSYAEQAGLSPLLVGYSGPGKPAQQAFALLRDAQTLRDAVAGTSASLWQQAIDFHAYALVALDHRTLLGLPLHEAYAIAAAAIRQADLALQTPDQVELPFLPLTSASAPAVVKLHATACLPDKRDQPATISSAR
jgi:hypothetical protein